MGWKKCPICDLNWITENEEMCPTCAEEHRKGGGEQVFIKPSAQECTILSKKDTIDPNEHCSSTVWGFIVLDQKDKKLGVICEDNKYKDHRAVIRYYNEYETIFGVWHKISSHGVKISTIDIDNMLIEAVKAGRTSVKLWID